jgi:AAA15 family ATPase/GTPase
MDEHIKNIEIKNFKSIRHQTIDDCRRINVFIGYPNVGKSNILEALGLYSISKNSNNICDFVRFEEIPTLFFNGDIQTEFQVKINQNHIVLGFLSESFLSIQRKYTKDRNLLIAENLQIPNTEIDEKWSLQLGINKVVKNFRIKDSHEIVMGHFLGSIRKYSFRRNVIGKEEYSHLSVPFGENLFAILSSHPIVRKEVVPLFKPYNLLLNIDKTSNTIKVAKDLKDGTIFTIPFSMIADTLERLIFHKVAIKSNKNSILVFEEPEAHMFPPYISKFTSDMVYDENENQFFITTHSPFVLNDLISNTEKDELSVYIVSYENETGETLIHRMSEEDVNEAYQFGYDFFMNIDNFIPQKQHE